MAQPTQELPPWFTASVTTITDAEGIPISTSTTLLFLPLTYYGPSIPLGPDWTYGGLTSPASTSAPSTTAIPSSTSPALSSDITTTIPPSSTTAIPSSTSSFQPSSSLSSLSISSLTSSPNSPISTTSSGSPTATASSSASSGRRPIIAIVLGSVFGAILLLIVFALYVWLRRRRHRQPRFSIINLTSEEDFYVVGERDLRDSQPNLHGREPGVGSPRLSGDEFDPFLVHQRAGQDGSQTLQGGVAVPRPPPSAPPVGQRPVSSTSTNSGYGTVIDTPTLGFSGMGMGTYGPVAAHENDTIEYTSRRGPILSRGDLSRLDEENLPSQTPLPTGADHAPLLPPPRLDPDQFGVRSGSPSGTPARPRGSQGSFVTKRSSFPIDAEEAANATVLTARRVKMEDLGPRSPTSPSSQSSPLLVVNNPDKPRSSGTWLSGLPGLGRLSWFKNTDSPTGSTSNIRRTLQYAPKDLTDEELAAGRVALLVEKAPFEEKDETSPAVGSAPTVRSIPVAQGDRPMSSVSARSAASGNTLYHDAQSSLRGTNPSPAPSHLHPSSVPRATTPHSQRHSGYSGARDMGNTPPDTTMPMPNEPPSYDDSASGMNQSPRASYPGATAITLEPHGVVDILDLPVPAPMLPTRQSVKLVSVSLTDLPSISSGSIRVSATDTHATIKGGLSPLMPPGLWQDTSTMTSTTRGTEGASTNTPSFSSLAPQRSLLSNNASLGVLRESDFDEPISIEVLEELPPVSGDRWRSLAQAGGQDVHVSGDRRLTFGLPASMVHPHETTASEQASLFSMRSHLAPVPARSAGSAPASPSSSARHSRWAGDGSLGSNSSRPSAHSAARSHSSASAMSSSLSHAGSFTRSTSGAVASPTLSAFGHHGLRLSQISSIPSSTRPNSGHRLMGTGSSSGFDAPLLPVPEQAARADLAGLSRVAPPEVTAGNEDPRLRPVSPPISQISVMPWAGGLEKDWAPA